METVVVTLGKLEKRTFKWISFSTERYPNLPDCFFLRVTIEDSTVVDDGWFCDVRFVHSCKSDISARTRRFARGSTSISLNACCERWTFAAELHNGKKNEIETIISNGTSRFTDETQAKKLNANLKIFFDDSDKPIYTIREFLMAYSSVFRAMFGGDFKEKNAEEVTIKDMKKEDFLGFLDSLYQPATSIRSETLEGILLVADRYDCKAAMEMGKYFMMDKKLTTLEEHKLYIELAQRYKFTDLLEQVLKSAPHNFLAGMLNPDWLMNLQPETMKSVLEKCQKTFE